MDSSRDYRDTTGRDIRIPREAYYRCLWTVRDCRRLAEIVRLSHMTDVDAIFRRYIHGTDELQKAASGQTILVSENAAEKACEDLKCISNALARIPEVYREGLLDNIVDKTPFSDFAHHNTWKRWKLVFIYELARELHLI